MGRDDQAQNCYDFHVNNFFTKLLFLKGPNTDIHDKKSSMIKDDLLLSSYQFDLPEELIAQRPIENSRLLVYRISTGEIIHDYFENIGNFLPENSLLVFNRSKVFPSRLIGQKSSGGKAELFLLSLTSIDDLYLVLIKTRSKKKLGDVFLFENGLTAIIKKIEIDGTFGVEFNQKNLRQFLDSFAKIPIPPYIRNGESDQIDKIDYQTIYAKEEGSVAAPTAGLHFKPNLLSKLKSQSIEQAFVTLHVGLGTFRPVSTSNITEHHMHSENFFIDNENLDLINQSRKFNKKIIAVGTTSLRVLESSFGKDMKADEVYSTNIFLHPGKSIQSIDGLITNFHLPGSSLLMLVSSLISRQKALELYQIAIKEKYRFFSYGDGMLILR